MLRTPRWIAPPRLIPRILAIATAAAWLPPAHAAKPAGAVPPPAAVAARAEVVTTTDEPARQVRTADGRLFIDFGRATFGWLELTLPKGHSRLDVTVHLGEKATATDAVDTVPGGSIAAQTVAVPVAADARVAKVVPEWRPKYAHWIPNAAGAEQVMPFRYAEIRGLPADIVPQVVRVSRHVPFDESAATFACSDPALVEVWDLCKHSIKATSFLGLYVDGNRERIAYEADAYINQLCHYGVDAHYETGRLTLEHLLRFPTWPTEWRQHVPLMAWADWLYSGDDAALHRNYDAIRATLMLDRRRPDGLFLGQSEGVPRDIVDWPACERDGYDMDRRVKTVTSAFHARSLEAMAAIARATGRQAEADEFNALRQATARALHEKLFDTAAGRYVDGLDPDTESPSGHASLHATMLPLAFGLVPGPDVARAAAFVAGRGMACSVYGAQYLLDGLFDAGRDRDAVALLTATGDRSWLHMRRNVGSTITLEAWDAAYKPNLDWNHAWGAVPANVIPRKLMGIEPLEPGFRRIRVRPRLGGLEWATIRHPSPRGPIDLAVTTTTTSWEAMLNLPEGVVAEVHVPTSRLDAVSLQTAGEEGSPELLRRSGDECVIAVTRGPACVRVVRPDGDRRVK
ncbi:MAG: alpha-L-rhamnosidase C-terminal domain-containing protein [Planctomycetaceae bacterium]